MRAASVALLSASGAVALVPTAASAATDAIVTDSGCTTNALAPNDDGSTGAIPLPSPLKFYDRTVSDAFVNNNGNITFDSPMGDFSGHISTLPRPLVAPFFADLDTRGTGVPVTYGDITFGGRPALCVNWHDIGFFDRGTSPTNDFQALLVDRSDLVAGDFDVIFNYGRVGGDYGGAAQIGFSSADGNPDHVYVFPGSGTSGAFLDSNLETGLVNHARESAVLGRYVFHFRRGLLSEVPPPDTSITTEAEERSNDASPSFTYATTAPEPEHGRFDCRITLEGQTPGPWTTCPDDGMTYDDLADGTWTFEVRGADVYLNADETPASSTITIDTAGPATTFGTTPAALGNDNTPSFSWSTDAADFESFECNLGRPMGGEPSPWEPCDDEGVDISTLGDGDWTFQVRAIDDLGNVGEPASYDFAIDTEKTGVTIETAPARLTNLTMPEFTYSFDPSEDVKAVECRVFGDEETAFAACDDESHQTDELADGDWTFEVRAIDRADNVGDAASWEFTVDTTPTDVGLTSTPRELGNDTTPTFTYLADPGTDLDHFECVLVAEGAQSASLTTCDPGGFTSEPLADGSYRFGVRAIDLAGNVGDPALYDFAVDTVAPESSITAAPAAMVGTDAVTFGFASDADPSTFECRLSAAGQTAAWESCSGTTKTFSGLADGGHTFEVRATDTAGNTDATPATGKVEVNVGKPTLTASIVSKIPISAAGWYRNTVTITYSCAGNGSALTSPCPAGREVPRAQRGRNTFRASIKTEDGDSASVSTTLYIDKGRPSLEIKGFSGTRAYTSIPKPRCVASDPRSGLDDCTIRVTKVTQKDGDRVIVVRAKATDKAGNVRVVKKQAPFRAA